MYPNYATVEECVWLCPIFSHVDAEDENVSACRAYHDSLTVADVFNELPCWGGGHGPLSFASHFPDNDYGHRYLSIIDGNIRGCWKYDLRREFILDELKND